MNLPPYGKLLAERQRFGNLPVHAVVCIGLDSWSRAKCWYQSPDAVPAMALPPGISPESLHWPIQNLPVVIDAAIGPSLEQVGQLALVLLQNGALAVTLVSFTNSHPFTRYHWSRQS